MASTEASIRTRRAISQWITSEGAGRGNVSAFRDSQLAAERQITSIKTKIRSIESERTRPLRNARKKFKATCVEEEIGALSGKEILYPDLLAKLKTALVQKKHELQQRTSAAQKRMMSAQHTEHHLHVAPSSSSLSDLISSASATSAFEWYLHR